MISFDIRLSKMDDVRRFVATTSASPVDVDLVAGRYLVDGKSIMGIFSLDLSKPVNVQIHTDAKPDEASALAEALKEFVA
ncbi:MAG: HPr family phosphocarrier protein [Clostridia bacterium]|nr:HPr family phosphocarrier protein [Clostridia bacterium]